MNYGYNIGAAGVLAAMHRQDVAANNLANIQTTGFKPDASFTIPRAAAREEDGLYNLPSNALLERLGAGVLLAPNQISFKQGSLNRTRNPLDIAVQGGGFLTVAANGPNGAQETHLTRDGRLMLEPNGRLVTIANQQPLLDGQGNEITLSKGLEVQIEADGTIMQGGQAVAKLGLVDTPNKTTLQKVGEGQYIPPGGGNSRAGLVPATGEVVQYATEDSGAEPIQAMMAVQSAADLVGVTAKVMQIQDDLMNRAINTLGHVTA